MSANLPDWVLPSPEDVERVARAICDGWGENFDALHRDKQHWTETCGAGPSGRFRDINEPRQDDFRNMALAVIAAWNRRASAPQIGKEVMPHTGTVSDRDKSAPPDEAIGSGGGLSPQIEALVKAAQEFAKQAKLRAWHSHSDGEFCAKFADDIEAKAAPFSRQPKEEK